MVTEIGNILIFRTIPTATKNSNPKDYLSALKPKTIQAIRKKAAEYADEYQKLIIQLDEEANRRKIEAPPSPSGGGARSVKAQAVPQKQAVSANISRLKTYTESEWNGAIASMGRLVDIRNFPDAAANVLFGNQKAFLGKGYRGVSKALNPDAIGALDREPGTRERPTMTGAENRTVLHPECSCASRRQRAW